MLDTHLLNVALAALGIGSGAAILIAAAIVAAVAIRKHVLLRQAGLVKPSTRVHGRRMRHQPVLR